MEKIRERIGLEGLEISNFILGILNFRCDIVFIIFNFDFSELCGNLLEKAYLLYF